MTDDLPVVSARTASAPSTGGPAPTTAGAEPVATAYDGLASGYDDFHVDAKSRAENDWVRDRLAARIGPSTRLVDLGCGTGLLLDLLPVAPDRYLGIDISEGMLERARAKHPDHRFVRGDIQNVSPELGRFDLVVSLFGSASYCGLEPFARSVGRLSAEGAGHFLMYCGPRYLARSTYINKGQQLLRPYSQRSLRARFPASRVRGMSWLVDAAPGWLPAPLLRGLLEADVRTAGRYFPDRCFFLVVER